MDMVYWAPTRYQVLGYFSALIILFGLQCFNSQALSFIVMSRGEDSVGSVPQLITGGARLGRQRSCLWPHPSIRLPTTGQSFSGTGWWHPTLVTVDSKVYKTVPCSWVQSGSWIECEWSVVARTQDGRQDGVTFNRAGAETAKSWGCPWSLL